MSAPQTNIEKQEKRHKGPLTGMPLAVIIAAVAFVAVVAFMTLTGTDDENASATEVMTETGATEEVEATPADDASAEGASEETTSD